MPCPICDQKPMNCDCTDNERRQYSEISDLQDLADSLYAKIATLNGRIAYLTSVKDASRLARMRLAEENLWLRELAGIAPDAEVPRPPKQWTPEEQ